MNPTKENIETREDKKGSVRNNIAYALPTLPVFLLMGGPMSVMPGLYVKYFGLSLGAIALAKVLSRIFDGLTDPVIGYISDVYQQRFGTRKPLVVAGCVFSLLTATMLYIPYGWDAQQSESVYFSYFLFFFLAYTLAWTVFDIPHLAWGADISSDSTGRSQRFGIRSMMSYSAPLLFFSIPLLPIFNTTEITPETLEYAVYLAWALMPVCLFLCLNYVPDSEKFFVSEKGDYSSKKISLKNSIRLIIDNRPLLCFYMAYALVGVGYVMSNSLTFFFVDNYLGLADKMSYVFMVHFGVGACTSWFWGVAAKKIGPRPIWAIGVFLCVLGLLGVGFIHPSGTSFWPYIFFKAIIGAGFISTFVAGYMLLASIVDYGKWKFDQDCSGTYFALNSIVFKFNAAIGAAIGLFFADILGFDATETIMSEVSVFALRLPYIVIPVILLILAIIVISQIPLSKNQQLRIRQRLEARVI